MTGSTSAILAELRNDLRRLRELLRIAGVPAKLVASIERKCLRTPRRQTGRPERRTNRQPRWALAPDHPDYSSELDAHLVLLKLLLDMLAMRDAPVVEKEPLNLLRAKYMQGIVQPSVTSDPLTDEPLGYAELVEDIVTTPKHGYSRFHIGHQDPKAQPKHLPGNIRWQLKASNDFQGTMNIQVARIAYLIDQYTRTGAPEFFRNALQALTELEARQ